MVPNHMRRAADLKVDKFAEGTVNTDIAQSIVDHFASQNIKILSIQQCKNKVARVTFADPTACECVQLRGELEIGGVKVAVVPPPPPPPNWTNVVAYNYPYDAPEAPIRSVLGRYGTVQNIRYQYWTNLPEVSTGTRFVRINLKGSIPRFVMFGSYRCKVWYRGQPVYCDICKEATHIAFNCPLKGKCIACKGVGHFARNCPNVCFKCKGDHASDSCPNHRGWERVPRDDDDFQSVTSEVGADVARDDVDADVEASAAQGNVDVTDPPTDGMNSPAVLPVPEPPQAPGDPLSCSLEDERFNQLDELHSSPDGSFDAPESQSVLPCLTQIVQEACEFTVSPDSPVVTSPVEEFKLQMSAWLSLRLLGNGPLMRLFPLTNRAEVDPDLGKFLVVRFRVFLLVFLPLLCWRVEGLPRVRGPPRVQDLRQRSDGFFCCVLAFGCFSSLLRSNWCPNF